MLVGATYIRTNHYFGGQKKHVIYRDATTTASLIFHLLVACWNPLVKVQENVNAKRNQVDFVIHSADKFDLKIYGKLKRRKLAAHVTSNKQKLLEELAPLCN